MFGLKVILTVLLTQFCTNLWASDLCQIQLNLTSEGENVYNLDATDPEKKFIKAAFTEHIQSIIEGVENAGLVIRETSTHQLNLQLNYLRSDDNLIRGLSLKMDGMFDNKYEDISIINHAQEKNLKFIDRKGLAGNPKKLKREIAKMIFSSLRVLQKKSYCL